MSHRLTAVQPNPKGAGFVGICRSCGKVRVVIVLGKPQCPTLARQKRAEAREKKTQVKKRVSDRKRAVRSRKQATRRSSDARAQLWRDIVFERAKRCCEVCGKGPFEKGSFQLQAHHLVKRSQSKRLLLDPLNGCALCAGCHLSADRDPIRCLAIINEIRLVAKYLLKERRSVEKRTLEVIDIILEQAWLEVCKDWRESVEVLGRTPWTMEVQAKEEEVL